MTKEEAGIGFRALVLALLALASGHMLSTLAANHPGDQPRFDGAGFRHLAAGAGET